MSEPIYWGNLTPEGEAERARLQGELRKIIEVAHKHGWNGVENSKILANFLDDALAAKAKPATLDGYLMAQGIRCLPAAEVRVETGPLQFGADHPGVFVRGENAAYYVMALAQHASKVADPEARSAITELQKVLGECLLGPTGELLRGGLFAPAPRAKLTLVVSDTPPAATDDDKTS